MERIETKEALEAFAGLTSSEERLFRRGLLAYYGSLVCFTDEEDTREYIPSLSSFSSFAEKTDEGRFLGVVYGGRAALIPLKIEVIRNICMPKEKPF